MLYRWRECKRRGGDPNKNVLALLLKCLAISEEPIVKAGKL